MNAFVEVNLAALLFLPWFAILAVLYWLYPRQPRPAWRWWFDIGALAAASVLFLASLHRAQAWADRGYGKMWQQIVGTSVSYGVFLAALGLAFWLRHRMLRKQ